MVINASYVLICSFSALKIWHKIIVPESTACIIWNYIKTDARVIVSNVDVEKKITFNFLRRWLYAFFSLSPH